MTLRVSEPSPGLLAFYDGRDGQRFLPFDNWVDDGAISLGTASYALIHQDRALVYDTHVSVPHAKAIRAELLTRGVRQITVVLSHWHLDHVAGTAAFADCPVISNIRTAAHLTRHKDGIEDGSFHGPPAINPLILPTQTFDGTLELAGWGERVVLLTANIHSDDATLLWLPDRGLLLAGDVVEDCVTYVGAPADFAIHLADLARLAALPLRAVLPNHGAEHVLASGGYPAGLIAATARYIRWLQSLPDHPERHNTPMAEAIGPDLASGVLQAFAPYETVHRQNIARTLAHADGGN